MPRRHFSTSKKRVRVHPAPESESEDDIDALRTENAALKAYLDALHQPLKTAGAVYDGDSQEDQTTMARALWAGGYAEGMDGVRAANPEIIELLDSWIQNTYRPNEDRAELHAASKARLVDGVLANLVRAQSQKKMPLLTAALSVVSYANSMTNEFHDVLAAHFRGALASSKWIKQFVQLAMAERPPPDEEMLPRVAVAAFDNLQMKIDYGAIMVDGESGTFLDMTTWLDAPIPARFGSATFDADKICAPPGPPCASLIIPSASSSTRALRSSRAVKQGMFRTNISFSWFGRQFYRDTTDLRAGMDRRWVKYLKAARNGRLLDRPDVRPEWLPRKNYHRPIYGRLQASYDDVLEELRVIRNKAGSNARFIFCAGDGAALMRLNHLISAYPDEFIQSTPVIIPLQGRRT